MNAVVFGFPGNELLVNSISDALNAERGIITIHRFPDEESLVRIEANFAGKEIVVVATLDHPDNKILPLYFLCKKLKAEGAKTLTLIAPYLAYMRQDKSFHLGEIVSSDYFAALLSSFVDRLITVDPHLHRHHSLREIFTIPCHVVHSSSAISSWIRDKVDNPVLIGPDSESRQWVSQVASEIHAPYVILNKERLSDRSVKISFPDAEKYKSFTPVIMDDIISTAHTMIETIHHLKEVNLKPTVCIGVHALFVENAYEQLIHTAANMIATCNTIPHSSNKINVHELIIQELRDTIV
ncbi:MAG: ribose-phosphate pyrophosphokinase [Bacteroidetes bacterium]|nr:ribose-phosphate pyrophosphokinase [Bacteroidota bacterium]MBI3482501.1 ribose-phosphate pyrophosphokinase [Bacteroidota bacterium]